MVVLLTEETILSEWRLFEWEMAQKLDIPVKCVLDMRNERDVVLPQIAQANAHLLQYPWLEWTEQNRHSITQEIERWIADRTTQMKAKLARDRTRVSAVSDWTNL